MSNLGWVIYLIDVFDKASTIIGIISIIASFALCALVIGAVVITGTSGSLRDELQIKKLVIKASKRTGIATAILILLYGVIPNRSTCYQIFAVNTAVELYQNTEALQQLPEKSFNALNRILDSICEEEKNDSKDESR